MRTLIRLSVGLALSAATSITMLAASASPSFGFPSSHGKPALSATQAAFVIPSSPTGTWTLMLFELTSPKQTLVGETQGASGTLTLPVPQFSGCNFQVDVKFAPPASPSKIYSWIRATVPGCGQSGNGPRLTPGYWKNHQSATQALLPQNLGSFVVTSASEATAIFNDMKCSDAIDCLAGHLLAAELDMAGGASICISGVVFQSNQLLTAVGYAGPASYAISSSQRAEALNFQNLLDNYTNDSTSSSC